MTARQHVGFTDQKIFVWATTSLQKFEGDVFTRGGVFEKRVSLQETIVPPNFVGKRKHILGTFSETPESITQCGSMDRHPEKGKAS